MKNNNNHPFMKRIIYSCLLFVSLIFSQTAKAQIWNFTVTPDACYYGTPYQGTAAVTPSNPAATSYTWSIVGPGGNVTTFSPVPNTPYPGEQMTFTLSQGCGQYTITCFPFNGSTGIPPNRIQYVNLYCPPNINVSASSPSICAGAVTQLSISGVPSVTWNPGGGTANPNFVSPTANTCYTAIGASAQGCTTSAVTCVTVQTVSIAITPASQTVCAGIIPTLSAVPGGTGYTFQWYQTSPGPTVTLGTASTQTANPAPAGGTWSVNGVYNTCTVSATASIAVGGTLSINVIPTSYSVCPFETFTMTAFSSATSYSWAGQGINPPTFTATGNPTTAIGPGTYTLVGRNGICTGSTQITIAPTVFSPTVTATPTAVCVGETVTLTATGGIPGSNYGWGYSEPPNTTTNVILPVPTVNTIVVTPTVTTIYGVVTSNSAGCTNTASPATVTVNIIPPVTVTAAISAPTVCAGSQVTLTAGGASSYTFVSASGTLNTGTLSIITDTPVLAQTYSVYGSNAAGFCVSAPATVAVSMATAGAISLTLGVSPSTICANQSASLTATASISNPNYVWTPSVSLNVPNAASVIATPSLNTVYTVNVDNGSGCTGSGTLSVVVVQKPLVSASGVTAVCAGYTSTLTAMGAASYTWMGSTLSSPIYQQTISVSPGTTVNPIATYTVVGAPLGANCISDPFVVQVSLAPDLVINIQASPNGVPNPTTCITTNASPNNTVALSKPIDLTASGATTYNWIPYNPAYMTYPTGPGTTVRPPTSTCYTVIGSTESCSGKKTICITVIPQFTMNVVPFSPVMCLGDSVTMSVANVGTLAAGNPQDWRYDWYEAANAPPPSLNYYGTPTVTAYPQNTTTYTVEVHDARACASLPRLVTVTVLPLPITSVAVPTINNVPTRTLCFVGDIPGAPDVYLDLNAYNNNVPALPFGVTPTYTWDSPYTPESFVTSQYAAGVTIVAPKRTPSVVVYTVTSGYNGVKGCKQQDTVTVRVIDCRPIIQDRVVFTMDIESDTICTRDCITFEALTDTVAGGPQTYSWTFPGGSPNQSTSRSPVICYNVSNYYDVILTVTSPYPLYKLPVPGSTATRAFRKYIKVMDVPNVTIVPPGRVASDTTIRYGQSVVLSGTNAARYEWSPGYALSPSVKSRTVEVNPTETTQYILTGYNSSRCFSSDTINVIVIQDCGDMFIPNAFSPNGDGVNDVLRVRGACLQTLTFMVFNRWGEKVFETNDVNVGWDGTYHGELMNTGVFVYRLEGKTRDGKGYSSKGNVTLVR